MSFLRWWPLPLGVWLVSWRLTGRFLRYAAARRLLDVPNARSSHVVPTPRGGGMAIVVTTLPALVLLGALGALGWNFVWGLLGAGAVVAGVGFVDDHGHVAPRWRLIWHFAAAAWVLGWLGRPPPLPLPGVALDLGWAGAGLAALYLAWLVNLTNFMDGIDGIAGVEAVTIGLGGALAAAAAGTAGGQWLPPSILAAASLGFLIWNWPPAKVFMGDAGSGFLGLMLGALSLQAARAAPRLIWSWLILLGVFVVDATMTLGRRMARGERCSEAHRNHAYQHAAQRWGAHRPVTLAVAAINLCWLLPLALLVAHGSLEGVLGVLMAYAPLVAAALLLRAGLPPGE